MYGGEIGLMTATGSEIKVNKNQAMRFMGFKNECADESFNTLYESCLAEFQKNASYKACFKKSSLSFCEGNLVRFDFCEIDNEALRKNLDGCDEVLVFAATAGIGADRLIMKYGKISQSRSAVIDCIASSAAECWCDEVCRIITEGKSANPRFSPGYGGVDLKHQKDILSFLDAYRKTGISLSDSLMMTPSKSVTAFIGIRK